MPRGRYPVVLPNHQVRRVLERDARVLILRRRLPLGERRTPKIYEIHDGLIARRNRAHCRNGRPDLQSDPHVLTIEVLRVSCGIPLAHVSLHEARLAGYRTVAELHEERTKRMSLEDLVFLHRFEVVTTRYLHTDIHRGYTYMPEHALRGEQAALTTSELEKMAAENRARFEDGRRGEIADRNLRSVLVQLKDAIKRGDVDEIDRCRRELKTVERQARRTA